MDLIIDHIVLTTQHPELCRRFYVDYHFGTYKINVHFYGRELEPRAHLPVPGSLDICFSSATSPEQVIARAAEFGIAVIAGPVHQDGAKGGMTSVYLRDPDLNLVEISHYLDAH